MLRPIVVCSGGHVEAFSQCLRRGDDSAQITIFLNSGTVLFPCPISVGLVLYDSVYAPHSDFHIIFLVSGQVLDTSH